MSAPITSPTTVWSIAGSDCSGGAGIQADSKTIHNLGAEACTVITAVTAQNSLGVQSINPVAESVLISQLDSLQADKTPRAIKIGMLANNRQVEILCEYLQELFAHLEANSEPRPLVVYDPVAMASSGGDLCEQDILPTVKEKLLPLVDIITPNVSELQTITGVYLLSFASLPEAAQSMQALGPNTVVIKGGHLDVEDNYCVDFALEGEQMFALASPRIDTEHSHGSGCTFASAIASLMAQGYLLRDAFTLAKAYINQGLRLGQDYDGMYGPLWQGPWPINFADFPEVLIEGSPLADAIEWQDVQIPSSDMMQALAPDPGNFVSEFPPCDLPDSPETAADSSQLDLGLYPVIDSIAWLERLLKAGVKTIQLREKHAVGQELEQIVAKAVALGEQYGARLFINDHWQLAIKHNAYGVHLGQEDIQVADLSAIKAAGLRLGISTHGHYELLKALQIKPSYLAIGAIFPTRTKDMTGQIQGLKTLQHLVDLLNNESIPIVAIGGINLERAPRVWQTGVNSIAVVTAITEAQDPEQAVADFMEIIA